MVNMKRLVLTAKFVLLCVLFTSLLAPHTSAEQNTKILIDNYVETFLKEYRIPGASVAITHNSELFYAKAWGITGESGEKVTIETPFTVGSISKSLTGLAIMKLMEEDAVHLEDPVQKYIPWFTLKDKQAAAQITIEQLLTHTSGISTYSGLLISDRESKDFNAIKNNVKKLSNIELTAPPGEKHQYSNANFLILGALIEEVTHQTYSKYMEQQVFLPLGMKTASADNNSAYKKGYLAGYQSWFGFPLKSSVTYDNGGAPYGYITTSTKDMVQYIKFLSQQKKNNFLTEKTMNLYISPLVKTGENRYYGLGLRITNPDSEDRMIWHSGSTPDSHSEVFFIPETGWGGVILTNKNHTFEEYQLIYLKQGIINILNGEEPVDVPPYHPIVQLVTIAVICLLFTLFIYLIIKVKEGRVHKRTAWRIIGIIFVSLSIAVIPLLIYYTASPWHTIKVFNPDIGLITMILIILLALDGLLSIYISFKQLKESY